jgi:hypothetical protein
MAEAETTGGGEWDELLPKAVQRLWELCALPAEAQAGGAGDAAGAGAADGQVHPADCGRPSMPSISND